MNISVNLATHEARNDVLPKAIASLENQTVEPDTIRVWDNEQRKDLTDKGKFAFLGEGEIYFTCDDDIYFPPDYIERTLEALNKYPNAILTYHGRKLKGKGLNYYYGHNQYHFLRTVKQDTMIDIPGTGVMAFDSSKWKPDILQYEEDCMADVLMGLECAKADKKVICLKHDMWDFKSLTDGEGSIYQQESRSCKRQSELADIIWDIKYQK